MAATDDFFGTSIVGLDPYADQRAARIQRLSDLDSLLASGAPQTSTTSPTTSPTTSSMTPDTDPNIAPKGTTNTQPGSLNPTDLASLFMTQGSGGLYQPGSGTAADQTSQTSQPTADQSAADTGMAKPDATAIPRPPATPLPNDPWNDPKQPPNWPKEENEQWVFKDGRWALEQLPPLSERLTPWTTAAHPPEGVTLQPGNRWAWQLHPNDPYFPEGGSWSQIPIEAPDPDPAPNPPNTPIYTGPTNPGDSTRIPPGSTGTGSTGAGSTGDLNFIRQALQMWLANNFAQRPPTYGGQLTVPRQFQTDWAFNETQTGVRTAQDMFGRAWNQITGMMGETDNISGQVMPFLKGASSTLEDLMKTGGGPDITKALDDIRTKGLLDLDDALAQGREQYVNQGLGAGSDIQEGLARAKAQGYATINQQQSTLAAQMMNAAADRRLGAAGAETSLANTALQAFLGPAQIKSSLAQSLPGIAQGQSGASLDAAKIYAGIGTSEAGREQQNIQNQYQAFLQQQGYPLLNPAIAFATGFPPAEPVVQGGGVPWGQIFATLAPFIAGFSSRELKEDIVPVEASDVTRKLKKLPLYTWKYKWDKNTKHMGPIAEEFRDVLGVGDGKTINLIDVMGLMLATSKDLAVKHA